MDTQKYVEALNHESPDTVLGSIMSEAKFPEIKGIGDACDVSYFSNDQHDLALISQQQPMFYNYEQHRLVSRADVIKILEILNGQKIKF
ncbi:hypothetical protein ACYATP_08240 [Lactobacillaceae bacterium Melli_B4]